MVWALCSANVAFVKTTMFFNELPELLECVFYLFVETKKFGGIGEGNGVRFVEWLRHGLGGDSKWAWYKKANSQAFSQKFGSCDT